MVQLSAGWLKEMIGWSGLNCWVVNLIEKVPGTHGVWQGWGVVGSKLCVAFVTKPTHYYPHIQTLWTCPIILTTILTSFVIMWPELLSDALLITWLNPMTYSLAPVRRQTLSHSMTHSQLLYIQSMTNSYAPVRRQSPFSLHDALPTSLHSFHD